MYQVTRNNSDMYGLKYIPSIEPQFSNVHDWTNLCEGIKVQREFSDANREELLKQFLKIRDKCKCIVEIGVARNAPDESSTGIFLDNKLTETVYIGIDIESKTFLNSVADNIYTIQADSKYKNKVIKLMKELNLDSIDFLFIDGFHSVLQVLFDWSYAEFVSPFGIIGMHDTNAHPGPYTIFDAIDEKIFTKTKYCLGNNDWGISFIEKKVDNSKDR